MQLRHRIDPLSQSHRSAVSIGMASIHEAPRPHTQQHHTPHQPRPQLTAQASNRGGHHTIPASNVKHTHHRTSTMDNLSEYSAAGTITEETTPASPSTRQMSMNESSADVPHTIGRHFNIRSVSRQLSGAPGAVSQHGRSHTSRLGSDDTNTSSTEGNEVRKSSLKKPNGVKPMDEASQVGTTITYWRL